MLAVALVAPQVILAQDVPAPLGTEDATASGQESAPSEPAEPAPTEPADPAAPSAPDDPAHPSGPDPGVPPPPRDASAEPVAPAEDRDEDRDEPQVLVAFTTKRAKAASAAKAAQADVTVDMRDFSFAPATVSIEVGDSVTWTNSGRQPHDATADDGSFATPVLDPGDSASETFDSAGAFAYICSIHPQMTATVNVESSGGTSKTDDTDVSEEEAVASPDAAGTSASLPSTGHDEVPLAVAGALLLALGILARVRGRQGAG